MNYNEAAHTNGIKYTYRSVGLKIHTKVKCKKNAPPKSLKELAKGILSDIGKLKFELERE